ncbi:MAG TPA: F0F1 ATP synthase subunit epsilon [Rhizomicrobium sp.]|jgi:F-type H+-transporting ATPase subunit epsilon|nr:F0F1 ATP synthase subunit epsilon [Rhizomicrobium sp.]
MADKIAFDLVSPERLLLSESADMVTIPGSDGYMGVIKGHMPLISTLRAGMIDVTGSDKADGKYFIRGGFAEVNADKVTVLAEEAIPMTEMDIAVLDQRIKDVEDDLIAAKSDAERAKVNDRLHDLRLVRAAF